jgi:hypothetical protein
MAKPGVSYPTGPPPQAWTLMRTRRRVQHLKPCAAHAARWRGAAWRQTRWSDRGPPEGFAPENSLEGVGSVGPVLHLGGHGFQACRVDPSGGLRLLSEVLE